MNLSTNFILKGNIIFSEGYNTIQSYDNSYLVCEEGKVSGIFRGLPEKYKDLPVTDTGDSIIIPGLVDLHVHASQYAFRGFGMDFELLDWLNNFTFVEEMKFANQNYANSKYDKFCSDLKNSATTRACIFATIHNDATLSLADKLEQSGLRTYVGKVNMDRNAPEYLLENPQSILSDTENFITYMIEHYQNTKPIITPRFIPSCTDETMYGLGKLAAKYNIPVQSHLSENPSEIKWVADLCPDSRFYGDAYNQFGLFGKPCKTIQAHCVLSTDEELTLIRENGVFIAHCAQSNINLRSGVAPVNKMLKMGIKVGLGTDIAGGSSISIMRAAIDAIQASKLRWALCDKSLPAIGIKQAFHMATKGGGQFFGKVGSFELGYDFDAVVINDSCFGDHRELTLEQRLERIFYLSGDRFITHKYICGEQIDLSNG